MNWKNLKQNKCPKCSKELFVRSTGMISCDNPKCDFKIKPAKMNEIVNSMGIVTGKQIGRAHV